MRRITQADIEQLRRRITVAAERAIDNRAPTGRPAPLERTSAPSRHGAFRLEGEERRSPLGRFLMQEHKVPNDHMHGNIRVGDLQSIPGAWLTDISDGEAQPIDPVRWAFLDTETTGLAGGTGTCAFLVGVGAIEAGGFRIRLFFMRDYDEETAMLGALSECLSQYDALITYNGKSYDVPLLETRFRLKRQVSPLGRLLHVDLLYPARRIWSERMPNCRLGTLESEVLGLERHDDVPGSLIPQRYFNFLRTGNPGGLRSVFRHNVLDLISLACLGAVLMPTFATPGDTVLRHAEDMLGLARWLRKKGDRENALELYRKAIRAGLAPRCRFAAIWESARLVGQAGNRKLQVRLLQDLSRVANPYRASALEQLAKHYEHREKDVETALEMTRRAQIHAPSDDLDHREKRLMRKAGGGACAGVARQTRTGIAGVGPVPNCTRRCRLMGRGVEGMMPRPQFP